MRLNLQNCGISAIEPKAFLIQGDPLRLLDLSFNNLRTIPPESSSYFPKSASIRVFENQWNCDCNLYWLKTNWSHQFFRSPICATPQRLSNNKWTDLPHNQFACKPIVSIYPLDNTNTEKVNKSESYQLNGFSGSSINLTFYIQAYPLGHVNLLKDGTLLLISDWRKYKFILLNDRQWGYHGIEIITISNLELNDSGVYSLLAENSEGSDFSNISLYVSDPPPEPTTSNEFSSIKYMSDVSQYSENPIYPIKNTNGFPFLKLSPVAQLILILLISIVIVSFLVSVILFLYCLVRGQFRQTIRHNSIRTPGDGEKRKQTENERELSNRPTATIQPCNWRREGSPEYEGENPISTYQTAEQCFPSLEPSSIDRLNAINNLGNTSNDFDRYENHYCNESQPRHFPSIYEDCICESEIPHICLGTLVTAHESPVTPGTGTFNVAFNQTTPITSHFSRTMQNSGMSPNLSLKQIHYSNYSSPIQYRNPPKQLLVSFPGSQTNSLCSVKDAVKYSSLISHES